MLHALYILPSILHRTHKKYSEIVAEGSVFPSLRELIQMGMTFVLVTLAWIFFRAEDVSQAFQVIETIFSQSFFQLPEFKGKQHALITLLWILVCMCMEWWNRRHDFGLVQLRTVKSRTIRWGVYYAVLFLIVYFAGAPQQFIYFQF